MLGLVLPVLSLCPFHVNAELLRWRFPARTSEERSILPASSFAKNPRIATMIRFKNMYVILVIVLPVFVPVDFLSRVVMPVRPSAMKVMLVLLAMS